MKLSFFQAAVVSILLYGCTTWTLTKRLEKKLDGNYTRMLRAIVVKNGRKRQQETDSCINSREDTVVSFILSPSLSVAVPSFFLSLLLVLAFLPSFLPSLRCNTFVEQLHSEQKSPIQPLPCVFVLLWDLVRICIRANYLSQVRDLPSSNMLPAAISVFTLQARHVRACFECPGTQECWEQYWTSPGDNTPRDTNYTATCLPSRKLYKLDEPDTLDTAGEARTSS